MTVPVSTAEAASTALLSLVTSQVADLSVLIGLDLDFTDPDLPDDIIGIGTIDRTVDFLAQVGGVDTPGSMQESFTVELVVSVMRGGDQAAAVRSRALALTDAIESAVRGNVTLGGAVNECVPARSRYEPFWEDEGLGREAKVTVTVACWAVS